MNQALRGRHFSGQQGGNGQVTPQQTALAAALGEGWEIKFPISNHHTNWKVLVEDIGHPRYKIAVEVDGGSHRSKKQKTRYMLKSDYLRVQGWQVIRF